MIVLRHQLSTDADAVSLATGVSTPMSSDRTQQHFKDECDINVIVERFGITGQLPENARMPVYGDFTGVVDFHTAVNAVRSAQDAFDVMPAKVRARFENNPQLFVEFCSDPANLAEARLLGLAPSPPAPALPPIDRPVDPVKPTPP